MHDPELSGGVVDSRVAGLTIGKVARSAGLAIDTVRYYEREGLLEKPARTASGYRHYPPAAVSRLRFIRQAKELGFSLREIKELLTLRIEAGKSCADVRARAERKVAASCSGRGPTSECPILEAMESSERGQ